MSYSNGSRILASNCVTFCATLARSAGVLVGRNGPVEVELEERLRALEERQRRRLAFAPHERVRIVAGGEKRRVPPQSRVEERRQALLGRLLSGRVAVEAGNDVAGEALQNLKLLGGERRAQ